MTTETVAPRSLPDVLDARERRALVSWLCEVARDLGAGIPIARSLLTPTADASLPAVREPTGLDVLGEAEDLARWATPWPVPFEEPWGERFAVLATAMAVDAVGTWRIACNAVRAARGERVERWTAEPCAE